MLIFTKEFLIVFVLIACINYIEAKPLLNEPFEIETDTDTDLSLASEAADMDYTNRIDSWPQMNPFISSTTLVDYNTMIEHIRDFIAYVSIMLTTLKETMMSLPKVAESIKILTKYSDLLDTAADDKECECHATQRNLKTTNNLENNQSLFLLNQREKSTENFYEVN